MKTFNTPLLDVLVCPETRQCLTATTLATAGLQVGGGRLVHRSPERAAPIGPTDVVLVREDRKCAYPVVDGVPVLLKPEMLFSPDAPRSFDLFHPNYDEAYEEMDHYNKVGYEDAHRLDETGEYESQSLDAVFEIYREGPGDFPNPANRWIDGTFESEALWDAYNHIKPIAGKRVIQIGGSGTHALKFLLAGATDAWLLTPMLGEATYARTVAKMVGVEDRFHAVIGVAEELPFADDSFDTVFSAGCIHHTRTTVALPEIRRVLKTGGDFAAIDPWRAPFYGIGTKILGKREVNIFCRPLTRSRVEPLYDSFSFADVKHHGTLTRYPLIAFHKFGLNLAMPTARKIFQLDDRLCALIPPLRKLGSSVALLGTK